MAESIKERLARLAAEKALTNVAADVQANIIQTAVPVILNALEKEVAAEQVDPILPLLVAPVQQVQTPTQPQESLKPLSFKEKMALKNNSATAGDTSVVTAPAGNVDTAMAVSSTAPATFIADKVAEHDALVDARMAQMQKDIAEGNVDPATAQAYTDIHSKIELLESLQDSDLKPAMSELKKALMQNPNAVALMLDTDIGKMVISLRRITQEAQIESATEKKTGTKKGKNTPLSAEALAAVFDEL